MSTGAPPSRASPRYAGWRVVAVCYLGAVFCWGLGLYGHGVYLTELNRLHGWPTAWISAGITGFICSAALVVFISDAIAESAPNASCSSAPAASSARSCSWRSWPALAALSPLSLVGRRRDDACRRHHHVVGLWFDRKRPLAHQSGAERRSSGEILITPAAVLAIGVYGFSNASPRPRLMAAICSLRRTLGDRPAGPRRRVGSRRPDGPAGRVAQHEFWSVAAPFALG